MATQQKVVVYPKGAGPFKFKTFADVVQEKGTESLNPTCFVSMGHPASIKDSQWREFNTMLIGDDYCLYILLKGPNKPEEGGIHAFDPNTLIIVNWSDMSQVECGAAYYFNRIPLMEEGFQIKIEGVDAFLFSCAKGWKQHLPVIREINKLKSTLEVPFDRMSNRQRISSDRSYDVGLWEMKPTGEKVIAKETRLRFDEIEPGVIHKLLQALQSHKDLKHPNLISKLGSYMLYDGKFCPLQEYTPDLVKLSGLEPSKMQTGVQTNILIGILSGLQFLHSRGKCHMNLNLDAVLVSKDLQEHKLDEYDEFCFSQASAGLVSNSTYGTPAYLAPEMFTDQSSRDCAKGDVYSVGMILWIMVTGIEPYGGKRASEISRFVNVPPVTGLYNPDARPKILGTPVETSIFKSIIEDCWAHDPKLRPTVDELLQRVKELIQ